MPLLLGLDIGTTSTIGILIDSDGNTLATASRPATLYSDHPNWAEEDPEQWWTNVCAITRELLAKARTPAGSIAGIGVTGMVPALVLVDANGQVLRRSIQQNDARAIDEIEAMKRAIAAEEFFRRTGGSINQQVIASKLRWLAKHESASFMRIATVFGSYDCIAWRLTGVAGIEQNWALESGFVDIGSGGIDPELVSLGGIARECLPPVRASHAVVGSISDGAAAATGLARGTPVVAGCADHVASAYVAGAIRD